MFVPLLTAALLSASPAFVPAQAPPGAATQPAAAVTVPDTPAGRALQEFVTSFNAGGEKRRAWLGERTTLGEGAAEILKQDEAFLAEHGPVKVVRIADASASTIAAILRHE